MAIPFVNLPELGATMDGGAFCGVTTTPEGKHCAVLLLTNRMGGATYDEASGWAKEIGAELPSLSVMLMVFANIKHELLQSWYWVDHEYKAKRSSICSFHDGVIDHTYKAYYAHAVAVRLIPIIS